jgi:hypothetical protein
VDFKIYSLWGTGAVGPRGGFELLEGALIEMPVPGSLSLYIDNETGFSTTDQRNLFYETDYGERYDAQFLNHPDLPADFATFDTSPKANTLGVYPGFTSGHVHRGTDMDGVQVLNRDYVNPVAGAPVGTMDKTVSVYVTDGVNTKTKTFTVRLCEPTRYYTNGSGNTYGIAANTPPHLQVDAGKRLGVIYVSQDGDFTGAESGPGIHHHTIPDGIIAKEYFSNVGGVSARTALGHSITASASGNPVGDYAWPNSASKTMAIFLKAGETYQLPPSGLQEPFGNENTLLGSWGAENGGRAIISGENRRTYSISLGNMFSTNTGGYTGWRFSNLEFVCSDYSPATEVIREWWNELKYTDKTGTIRENTNGNLLNTDPTKGEIGWTGDILTNGNGAYAMVIGDVPDPVISGAGTLRVRQVVDNSNGETGNITAFSNGDVLENADQTGSVVFVAAGSRQDRVPKGPVSAISFGPNPFSAGCVVDGCIIRGPYVGINYPGDWSLICDTHIQNYFNYAATGDAPNLTMNGLVTSLPASYKGLQRGGSAVSPVRNNWNVIIDTTPNVPMINTTAHTAMRYGRIKSWALYKTRMHGYGGHGNVPQPLLRLATNGAGFGEQQVHAHKCIFSAGETCFQINSLSSAAPRTPKAWLLDQCWLRADYCTEHAFRTEVTTWGFRDSRIGWPSGVDIVLRIPPLKFTEFADSTALTSGGIEPAVFDVGALTPFFERCHFEFNADGYSTWPIEFDDDNSVRGFAVAYTDCTLDVDPTKVASFEQIP